VIIIASPDERSWGESNFTKRRGSLGMFLHFPIWNYEELLAAAHVLYPAFNDMVVSKRYHQFGGIPRKVLHGNIDVAVALVLQDAAINALEAATAVQLAQDHIDAVSTFGSSLPKSAIVGYALDKNSAMPFLRQKR
jgi:hypothetical protein